MYAYCGNNPVNMVDPTGESFQDIWKKIKRVFNNTIDFLQNFKNKDGSYSLYDGDRFYDRDAFHDQFFVITPSIQPIDLKEGKLGLGSVSADLITGGWEWKHFDLSLLDFGHVEAGAQFDVKSNKATYGAMASIWSPSCTVSFWILEFEIGGEIGSVGAMAKADQKSISFGFSALIGGTLSISWD